MKAQIRGSKYANKLEVRESFSGEVIPQQSLERLKRCQVRKAFQVRYERCEAAGKLAGWYIAAALSEKQQKSSRDFRVVQWLRLCTLNAGSLSSIPGRGTRSHMLQLKIQYGTMKTEDPTCHNDAPAQPNK